MPQHLFGTAGFGYTGAMVFSTEALKYVNFPTKVLGKSCKVGRNHSTITVTSCDDADYHMNDERDYFDGDGDMVMVMVVVVG